MSNPSRRAVLVGAASLFGSSLAPLRALAQVDDPDQLYAAVPGERFPVPAIDLSRINPRFLRQIVYYDTDEEPGTIIIDPRRRFLYFTNGDGRALRYGVGVGRQGFAWSGTANIKNKQEWPDWYPPKEMLDRDPKIMASMDKLQSGIGMHGGPGNPLGARAMYLWQGNRDTLYRIHGTIEPWTIGSSISSGCIRMINQDVMDLYDRVPIGTKVVVLSAGDGRVARRRELPPEYDDRAAPPDPDPDPTQSGQGY
jgi:lipoprotein-anchoring transpeptidase ErfK/SrfK